MHNQVETKVYECLEDFVLESVAPGEPGKVSYSKGEKYQLPAEVAALAPEGALKEVVVEQPPVPPVTPEEPPVRPAKTFVGGHTMADKP